MKRFFTSELFKLGLWIVFIQFLAVPLHAYQEYHELLTTNFEQSPDDSGDFKELDVLLPKSLEMLSFTSRQPKITITPCDSIYLLRTEFVYTAENIIVRCDVVFVKRDSNIVTYEIVHNNIAKAHLQRKIDSLAEESSKQLAASLDARLKSESRYKKIVCISDFEVAGDNKSDLANLALRTIQLLEKKLSKDNYRVKSGDGVYVLVGDYGEDRFVYIKCRLISVKSGKQKFTYEEITPRSFEGIMADTLAEQLYSNIVFDLFWRVRIGIAEFTMLGGDTTYMFLKGAIAANLKSYLKGVTLVEAYPDSVVNIILKTLRQRGKTDIRTELRFGKILLPQYLIMGQFWELNGEIGISTQCIKIETGEVILGKNINLHHVDVDAIKVRMAKLASDIQTSISRDIMSENIRATMTVVGLPPLPNTNDNRERTKFVIRAISKKLKKIDAKNINIKENREKVDRFLHESIDIWSIITEMNVDKLLVIQYENYGEGDPGIDANLYDSDDARTPIYSYIKTGDGDFEFTINDVIEGVSDTLRLTIGDDSVFKKDHIRTIVKPFSVGLSYNPIITSEDGPLEYSSNSSFSAYLSFPLLYRDPHLVFRYRPKGVIILTWDWGNNTLENLFYGTATSSVHLISLFGALKCNFRPDRGFSPYIGAGLGFLWLRRILGEGYSFIHAPSAGAVGVTLIGGGEIRLGRHCHLVVPLKLYSQHDLFLSFLPKEFDPEDSFNGGRLWGVNIGLGFQYNW